MEIFPTFKRGDSQVFFNKLPKDEKDLIEDFIKYVSITSKSDRRLENNKRSLVTFRKVTGIPLYKTTLKDLRNFLALLNSSNKTQASRNDYKHTIKRFLKWKFKDWSKRFDNLSDIKLIMCMNEEKINADTLLKKEDIESIMKEEPKLFWKAFFITLYESGLRPIELRTLTWKNIVFDVDKEAISEIHIYATKTNRARTVFVQESTGYLKLLKEKSNTDLVFPSVRDKTKPMGKELPAIWLKRISKKVLGKQVYPYILRHSRATELYTNAGIPDKTVQKFLGHSKSMSDVYTHLSNNDVKDAMLKTIYKTDNLPPERKHALEREVEMLKKKQVASTKIGELNSQALDEVKKLLVQVVGMMPKGKDSKRIQEAKKIMEALKL